MQKMLAVLSIGFIILGFGIVHSPSVFVERSGLVMISLGSLYLLFLLWRTSGNHRE